MLRNATLTFWELNDDDDDDDDDDDNDDDCGNILIMIIKLC